jgi:hypothetical protein
MAKKQPVKESPDNQAAIDAYDGIFRTGFGLGERVWVLAAGKEPILMARVDSVSLRAFYGRRDEKNPKEGVRVIPQYELKLFPKKSEPFTLTLGDDEAWRMFRSKESLIEFLEKD